MGNREEAAVAADESEGAGTVLIVDDSEAVRRHVESVLRQRELFSTYKQAGSGAEALRVLLQEQVDMILCDLEMPGIDGLKLLKLVEKQERYRGVPFIMLTGKDDISTKVDSLEAGASDFLTKPVHDEELVARVRVHLQIKRLQDELKQKNVLLERLAITDELTGVANRRALMDTLARELSRARRHSTDFSFVMLDIDHFKRVNDDYGHQAGDHALRYVADALRESLRTHDFVGRYGGEEFGIMLPHTGREGALSVAERHRITIAQAPLVYDGKTIRLTASFGVATYPTPRYGTIEALVAAADRALYRAKADGRNRVVEAAA